MLKKILFFPIACIYSTVSLIRNYLYDKGVLKSQKGEIPTIVVGNITVGGTGKTPVSEQLIEILQEEFNLAFLSRGYKRKSKGCIAANSNSTTDELGDEPAQIHRKFTNLPIVVCADRLKGISIIAQKYGETQLIILDDAMQHRRLKPSVLIMLTSYDNFFKKDVFLPAGKLRDNKYRYKQADIVMITKCPPSMTEKDRDYFYRQMPHKTKNQIFFATIEYSQPRNVFSQEELKHPLSELAILGVSGIANPKPFEQYLSNLTERETFFIRFLDHKNYSNDSIKKIFSTFDQIYTSEKIIITTEKDAVKLAEKNLSQHQKDVLYYIPVKNKILFNQEEKFKSQIKSYARKLTVQNQQSG